MSKEDADFLDRLRSLSVGAAHELLTGIDRLRELREEWVPTDPGQDPAALRSRYGDFAYRLAKAEVEHAEKILSMSHDQADMVFKHVRSLVRSARRNEPPASVLELKCSAPQRYEAAFEIYNPFLAEAFLRLDFPGFRTMQGAEHGAPAAQLTAPGVSLPARGSVEIVAVVNLAHQNVPAGVYFGELSVYLSADVERLVAQRMLRVNIAGAAA